MISLSKAAKEQLDLYFSQKQRQPIRIQITGGCGGMRLGLVFDQKTPGDLEHCIEPYLFLIQEELFQETGHVDIAFNPYQGFLISSQSASLGCASCGTCTGQ